MKRANNKKKLDEKNFEKKESKKMATINSLTKKRSWLETINSNSIYA